MNFGKECEIRAAFYATQILMWDLRAANVHSRYGEIDLVCLHDGKWIFIEVKGRCSDTFGSEEELLDYAKIHRLKKCIALWMRKEGWRDWHLELWEMSPDPTIQRRFLI